MEDMRKAAVAFYRRSDADQQQIAKQFFNQMDADRNGKICPSEFLVALKQVDYNESRQNELTKLFKKLDSNFDKNLDFYEALPFYYLIRHKTALFCSGCSVLLVGQYFSCLDCHVKGGNSYDLCTVCYQKGKFNYHIHKSLYDNIHLLQIYRNLVADQNANRKGTHVTSHVKVTKLASRIGSSITGLGQDGDALGLGSADPSLLMDIGGDVGTAGSDLPQYGSSLPDVADHGTSLADFAEQGSNLADIARQGSSLADVAPDGLGFADAAQSGFGFTDAAQSGFGFADAAQSGLGFADAAQSGLDFADAAQNVSDLVDVASVILTACSIM